MEALCVVASPKPVETIHASPSVTKYVCKVGRKVKAAFPAEVFTSAEAISVKVGVHNNET
jgi:hypothetical protein